MRILAIETSGRLGSVAALEAKKDDEPRLLQQIALSGKERTARSLAPSLRNLLHSLNWLPRKVDLVAVAVGPGSFTGLRIGVTTAKTFAFAAGAHILGVNTLAAIAVQAPTAREPLWTVLDAQRQELFAMKFMDRPPDTVAIDCHVSIVRQDEWLAALQPGDRVTGPALSRLAPKLPVDIVVVPEAEWQPMAESVGRVAWHAHRAGHRDDVWQLMPRYYRPSYAEEKKLKSQ